jgi:hypothetical protein
MARLISTKSELWGQQLAKELIQKINVNPLIIEFNINKKDTYEIYNYLCEGQNTLKLNIFLKSRRDRDHHNNVVPLLLVRKNEQILLPSWDNEIKVGDELLFACDENAKIDIEYIANNWYEFYYVAFGKERSYFEKFLWSKR